MSDTPYSVMVIDTVGGYYSTYYAALFPGVEIICEQPDSDLPPPHPHGFQVGYYAGVSLLPKDKLIFVRIFDERGQPLPGCDEWMLEMIEKHTPHVVCRSWGMWDGDTNTGAMRGKVAYGAWTEKYRALQARLGFIDFAAAGNDDDNDEDSDIDFPQQLMPDVSNIIGSTRRNGVPSRFSGDGPGLQCVAWAEDVPLCTNGFWQRGSGTSFAAPKAAGMCAHYRLLQRADWAQYVMSLGAGRRPLAWRGELPHPKWGWGNIEPDYQEMLKMLEPARRPPRRTLSDPRMASIAGIKPEKGHWHDFEWRPER